MILPWAAFPPTLAGIRRVQGCHAPATFLSIRTVPALIVSIPTKVKNKPTRATALWRIIATNAQQPLTPLLSKMSVGQAFFDQRNRSGHLAPYRVMSLFTAAFCQIGANSTFSLPEWMAYRKFNSPQKSMNGGGDLST